MFQGLYTTGYSRRTIRALFPVSLASDFLGGISTYTYSFSLPYFYVSTKFRFETRFHSLTIQFITRLSKMLIDRACKIVATYAASSAETQNERKRKKETRNTVGYTATREYSPTHGYFRLLFVSNLASCRVQIRILLGKLAGKDFSLPVFVVAFQLLPAECFVRELRLAGKRRTRR